MDKEINESSERLAFTIYFILKMFDPEKKGYLSLVRFYKVAYSIHRRLKKKLGINTGLPWYWYRFGPVVALNYCPNKVMEIKEAYPYPTDEQRIYFKKMPRVVLLPDEEVQSIQSVIKELRNEYLTTPEMVDIAYSDLEVDFLEKFRDFEEMVNNFNIKVAFRKDFRKNVLYKLDEIAKTYPGEGFEKIFGLFLRLEEVLRIVCEHNPKYLFSHKRLLQDFRELVVINASYIFCENMPSDWISNQQEKLHLKKREFETDFLEVEKEVFIKIYKRGDDRSGYGKKLMEISRMMMEEG